MPIPRGKRSGVVFGVIGLCCLPFSIGKIQCANLLDQRESDLSTFHHRCRRWSSKELKVTQQFTTFDPVLGKSDLNMWNHQRLVENNGAGLKGPNTHRTNTRCFEFHPKLAWIAPKGSTDQYASTFPELGSWICRKERGLFYLYFLLAPCQYSLVCCTIDISFMVMDHATEMIAWY